MECITWWCICLFEKCKTELKPRTIIGNIWTGLQYILYFTGYAYQNMGKTHCFWITSSKSSSQHGQCPCYCLKKAKVPTSGPYCLGTNVEPMYVQKSWILIDTRSYAIMKVRGEHLNLFIPVICSVLFISIRNGFDLYLLAYFFVRAELCIINALQITSKTFLSLCSLR